MELLETYQNLAVGMVGFAGVIIAIVGNAYAARRQRRDEIEHERSTLRSALVVELETNLEQFQSVLKSLPDQPAGGTLNLLTDPMEDAYKAFIGKIGLLTEPEVREVMLAYLHLRSCNARLLVIGVPSETGPRNVKVSAADSQKLKDEFEAVASVLKNAHEVLTGAADKRQGNG